MNKIILFGMILLHLGSCGELSDAKKSNPIKIQKTSRIGDVRNQSPAKSATTEMSPTATLSFNDFFHFAFRNYSVGMYFASYWNNIFYYASGNLVLDGSDFDSHKDLQLVTKLWHSFNLLPIRKVKFAWIIIATKEIGLICEILQSTGDSLVSITFENCSFDESCIEKFHIHLDIVESFTLKRCSLNEQVLNHLISLLPPKLTHLTISEVNWKGRKVTVDFFFEELKELCLEKTMILNEDLGFIRKMQKLQKLSLSINIFNSINPPIWGLDSLVELSMTYNAVLKSHLILYAYRTFPNLRSVKISGRLLQNEVNSICTALHEKKMTIDCLPLLGSAHFLESRNFSHFFIFSIIPFNLNLFTKNNFNELHTFLLENSHRLQHVNEVEFVGKLNIAGTTQMFSLLKCFPRLTALQLYVDEVNIFKATSLKTALHRFKAIRSIENLQLTFLNRKGKEASIELMIQLFRIFPNTKTIEIAHYSSNLFAYKLRNFLLKSKIRLQSVRLSYYFPLEKQRVKELLFFLTVTMNSLHVEDLSGFLIYKNDLKQLQQLPSLSIKKFELKLFNPKPVDIEFFRILFTKLDNLVELNYSCSPQTVPISKLLAEHRKLRRVTLKSNHRLSDIRKLFKLLPSSILYLGITYHNASLQDNLETEFFKKFSALATLEFLF